VDGPLTKSMVFRPLEIRRLSSDTRSKHFVVESRRKAHRIVIMKSIQNDQLLDVTALVGIVAALVSMVPVFFVAEMGALAVPAFVLLLASMLCGTR